MKQKLPVVAIIILILILAGLLIYAGYFLVKKRLHWAWADLVLLFFLVLFFVYQGLSDKELYPFFVMSAVALLVMLLLIVSLWRELKKRE